MIDAILNPQSIAIVGASTEPAKRGHRAIRMLLDEGYQGRIVPIHREAREILGIACFPGIESAPGGIDVALVCTPAATLPEILRQCGRAGVKGAIVVSGGFSEAGDEGRRLEEQCVAIAREHGVRLVGPNMNGIFSARLACNTSPWRNVPRGPIAVVSNSANVCHWLLTCAWARPGPGFSTMLSVGNQADVAFHEYVAALGGDPDTRAIIAYVEGFTDGVAFLDVARTVTARKPIVLYKAGRNPAGASMARSHSGSLAGDHAVAASALAAAGVTLVDRPELLLPIAHALSSLPRLASRNVAVISEGGGPLTIASEQLSERGLALTALAPATQARIREVIPRSTTIANPVDIAVLHDPTPASYAACAEAVLDDPGIAALLFVGWFGGYGVRQGAAAAAAELAAAERLVSRVQATGKALVVQSHYAYMSTPPLDRLRAAGVPVTQSFDEAVAVLAAAAGYAQAAAAAGGRAPRVPGDPAVEARIAACLNAGRDALLEHESRGLLATAGMPLPPHRVVESPSQLADAAGALGGGPLAMKLLAPGVLHKSDVGGVRLGLVGEQALREAMAGMFAGIAQRGVTTKPIGVLLTPMAAPGVEVIVGATRDPQFGPMVLCGLGGVLVEVLKDVAIRPAPITDALARAMLSELRGRALLEGARGRPPADIDALVSLLVAVSRLIAAHPPIAELDLNPVIVHPRGLSIVDARVLLAGTGAPQMTKEKT